MKLKTISLVTVVLLVLALISVWLGGPDAPPKSDDPLVGEPLVTPDALRSLSAVTLTADDGRAVRVEQTEAGQWMVSSEGGVPADVDRLRRLVSPLAEARVERFVTAREERKEGLALERHRLVLEGGGEEPILALQVGRSASAGGVYVQPVESDRVYLLDRTLSLDAAPGNWVDRTPLGFTPEDIARVIVGFSDDAGAEPVRLSRNAADDAWVVANRPDGTMVQESEVSRLLRSLGNLRTTAQVQRDDPGAVEAEAFARSITVTTFAGEEITLRLGRRPEGVPPADWAGPPDDAGEDLFGSESEPAEATEEEAETPPAGTPYLFLSFTKSDNPWAGVAEDLAFEIAEWTFNQLPADPETLVTPPAPPAEEASGEAASEPAEEDEAAEHGAAAGDGEATPEDPGTPPPAS